MACWTPSDVPVTGRQLEVLRYIRTFLLAAGRCPTVREIGARFEIDSPNGVICHLSALEKKGYVTREDKTARGIALRGARLALVYEDGDAGRRLAAALGEQQERDTAGGPVIGSEGRGP